MLEELSQLWEYRHLLVNLVARDMKVRYKNSVLGFLWSFIVPLAQVATLTVVFKILMGIKAPNYSAYILCAMIPFNFFSLAVLESTTSILAHASLVKKTYFPREILPASVVIANFIHFALAMGVFLLYLVALRFIFPSNPPPIKVTWLLLPVLMVINFMMVMGISLFLSALNTFYEDVKYMTSVFMGIFFYMLPIIYLMEMVIQKTYNHMRYLPLLKAHYFFNPLCYLITAYRKILMPPFNSEVRDVLVRDIPLNYEYLGIAALISFLIMVAGYAFFNSKKWYFAERM